MEKEFISEKIVYYRKLRGITQEELAEKTGLSVRTIQRIESADVDARLYTLKSIADALSISMDAFNAPPSQKAKGQLASIHFSALIGFLFPLGNIIIPLIFWLYKKDQVDGMDRHGKAVVNAQISYMILSFSMVIVFLLVNIGNLKGIGTNEMSEFPITLGLIPLFLISIIEIIGIVSSIVNGVRAYNGKDKVRYPLSFKLIK